MTKQQIIFTLLFVTLPLSVGAYVASSTNYQIELDSINFAGGLSTSTNYQLEDTAGEVGTGQPSSTNYLLYAGYQQMSGTASTTIEITSPADVGLQPNIPQTGGGTANGSATWNVITNSPTGYNVTIQAASSPALTSSASSFSDYSPAGAVPDLTFTVASNASAFGFSPEGNGVVSRFLDNGSVCGTGSGNTADACWDGLSTSAVTIVQAASGNSPSGTDTTVKFRAMAGASKTQPSGSYTAVITVTANAL